MSTPAMDRVHLEALEALEVDEPAIDYDEACYLPKVWRELVAHHTLEHRQALERHHRDEAYSSLWQLDPSGIPEPCYAPSGMRCDCPRCSSERRALWHHRRAEGQANRFEKLDRCGSIWNSEAQCAACDAKGARATDTRRLTCGLVNLCPRCRGREARRLRTKSRHLMANLPEEYEQLIRWRSHEWRWRFLTLTVPHGRGIVTDTRDLVRRLWPKFWRWVSAHIAKDLHATVIPLFIKCLEITADEDRDDDGHAHLHVAILSPFISRNLLGLWWGRALAETGRECPQASVSDVLDGTQKGAREEPAKYRAAVEQTFRTRRGPHGRPLAESQTPWQAEHGRVPFPVLDVRKTKADLADELVKYLVKDITAGGDRIAPRAYAEVYKAVSGRRRLSNTRLAGWVYKPPDVCCNACGRDALEWSTVAQEAGGGGRERENEHRAELHEDIRRSQVVDAMSYYEEAQRCAAHGQTEWADDW